MKWMPPKPFVAIETSRAGFFIICDLDDLEIIQKHRWHLGPRQNYAYTSIDNKTVRLHRFLFNLEGAMVVDHVNGNGLDNRRCNLRVCTQSQNAMNKPKTKRGLSKYKGITFCKTHMKWKAVLSIAKGKKKGTFIGYFDDEKDAAIAYDKEAIKQCGEFAYLNFPNASRAAKAYFARKKDIK